MGATKKNRSKSGSKKLNVKLPNFGTLAIGSLIGIALTSIVFYACSTSDITLKIPAKLAAAQPVAPEPEAQLEAKKDSTPPEPRFDFYTELTKNAQETTVATTPTPIQPVEKPKQIATVTPVAPPVVASLKSKTKPINSYSIQAGSFKSKADADSLRATLTLNGLEAKIESSRLPNGEQWSRVMLGPFKTEKNARSLQQLLKSYDINGILVVKYADTERG